LGHALHALVSSLSSAADSIESTLARRGGFAVERIHPAWISQRAADLGRDGARRIAVAGGDGTIRGAAAALLASAPTTELAVLPAGTHNHFAVDHGIPLDVDEAAALALDGAAAAVDVAAVGDEIFVNTSSIGDYSRFVALREAHETRFGYRLASFLAILRVFATLRWLDVAVEVEGRRRRYRTPCLLVAVGERDLKRHGGLRVPGGRRGLHVLVPRAQTRGAVARLVVHSLVAGFEAAAAAGRTLDSFHLEACRVTMPVAPHSSRHVALDGDILKLRGPFAYRVLYDALRVVGATEATA
jgi:diacylglycerol kinase family enzyme